MNIIEQVKRKVEEKGSKRIRKEKKIEEISAGVSRGGGLGTRSKIVNDLK